MRVGVNERMEEGDADADGHGDSDGDNDIERQLEYY